MNLSHSDSELTEPATPQNMFVSQRNKRKWADADANVTMADFKQFKEEMKALITTLMSSQQIQLQNNTLTLNEIKETGSNIETSISFLTAQNEELKKQIHRLEELRCEDRKKITILEEKLETMQIDFGKTNFEVKNVPKIPSESKEDLVDMVLCLSQTIGAKVRKEDIRDIYRVRGKKEGTQNTPIIVETSSTMLKTEVLKLCKIYNIKQKTKLSAKHLGMKTQCDTPVFVSEQLTAKAARLYFLARDLVKDKSFKFCWTAYGKIYLRKTENSPIFQIKAEHQIQELRNNNI